MAASVMISAEYRERILDIARAQECLRQAHHLAQRAAGLLAELNVTGDGQIIDPTLDLTSEIKLATAAGRSCQDAVDQLDTQIRRTPLS